MTKEKKVRESYLIKPGSRSEETKQKFSAWIDAQSNAQNSILSLILHSIDRFGYEDVMEHDIARKMYLERLHFEGENVIMPSGKITPEEVSVQNDIVEEQAATVETSIEKPTASSTENSKPNNNGASTNIKNKIDPSAF